MWDQVVWLLTRLVAGGKGVRRIVVWQKGGMPIGMADWVVKRRMGSLWPLVQVVNEWMES